MRRLLINIGIIALLLIPLLYVLQFVVDKGLRKSKAQFFVTWTDIYSSKVNADLLINGSSTATLMVSPKVIDSMLHLNSYNVGMTGWAWRMQDARLKVYMQHNVKPKYILHILNTSFFETRADLFDYQQFLPYLNDPIIRNATKGYEGSFSFSELYFPFFKYNNQFSSALEGFRSVVGKGAKCFKYKGFYPTDKEFDEVEFNKFRDSHLQGLPEQIDTQNVRTFLAHIDYCKANNIKLIFALPPFQHDGYLLISNRDEIMALFKKIAADKQIPLLDYTNDTICYDKRYFFNARHLNARGANVFTVKLAQDAKKYLE